MSSDKEDLRVFQDLLTHIVRKYHRQKTTLLHFYQEL